MFEAEKLRVWLAHPDSPLSEIVGEDGISEESNEDCLTLSQCFKMEKEDKKAFQLRWQTIEPMSVRCTVVSASPAGFATTMEDERTIDEANTWSQKGYVKIKRRPKITASSRSSESSRNKEGSLTFSAFRKEISIKTEEGYLEPTFASRPFVVFRFEFEALQPDVAQAAVSPTRPRGRPRKIELAAPQSVASSLPKRLPRVTERARPTSIISISSGSDEEPAPPPKVPVNSPAKGTSKQPRRSLPVPRSPRTETEKKEARLRRIQDEIALLDKERDKLLDRELEKAEAELYRKRKQIEELQQASKQPKKVRASM
ncbi:hypothetical protein C8J56DRAFT_1158635 [Mycena floridula]|nr:hypothetical protein C8J56DRAFT_1158635 [Mycena floridula]